MKMFTSKSVTFKLAFVLGISVSLRHIKCLEFIDKEVEHTEWQEKVVEIVHAAMASKTSFINIVGTSDDFTNKIFSLENMTISLESPSTTTSSLQQKKKLSQVSFNFRGFYSIISTKEITNETLKIFELLLSKQIYNAVILYEFKGHIKAFGFNSFNSTSCDNIEVYEMTNLANLFPEKLNNLRGCPIKVYAPFQPPFVFIENSEPSGRDVDLINSLAKALNFTLNLKILTQQGAWGLIFDNGTATNASKSLLDSEADILISEFYLKPSRLKFSEASKEYFQTDVVFVIPPGRNLLPIEKLLQPFSKTVWLTLLIALLILFIAISIIIWHLKLELSNQNLMIFFRIFSIMFAVSQPSLPKRSSARILTMTLLMFCIVIQASYQGSLYKFLQTESKVQELQTIEEMIKIKGIFDELIIFIYLPNRYFIFYIISIKADFMFFIFDLLLDLVQNDKKIMERLKFISNFLFL